jgi:hypothetical protein
MGTILDWLWGHGGTVPNVKPPPVNVTVNVVLPPEFLDVLLRMESKLDNIGETMSDLSDAVDAVLAAETSEDEAAAAALAAKDVIIADLQAQIAANSQALMDALANDAADAATIEAQQAALDAAAADTQAQIDRLAEAFLPHPDQTLPGDLPQ